MKREKLTAVVLVLAMGIPVVSSAEDIIERTGYAYKTGDEKLLYTEEHREWVEDGGVVRSVVTYRNAEGKVIATKHLDFGGDPVSPDFRLESTFNGHLEGARAEAGRCVVFFQKTGDNAYREETVDEPERAIIDGGFDRFIETNWQRLLEGEVFKRPFLVPSFQKFVNFKIYVEKTTDTDVVLVMEPASFLLRIVGDEIVVIYGRDNAVLKRYEGISNIRDRSGENYDVRVVFRTGAFEDGDPPG